MPMTCADGVASCDDTCAKRHEQRRDRGDARRFALERLGVVLGEHRQRDPGADAPLFEVSLCGATMIALLPSASMLRADRLLRARRRAQSRS